MHVVSYLRPIMSTETVHDRFKRAKSDVPLSIALIVVVLAAALGFTLLFLQDPMVHDTLHDFRHAAGITCH